MKTRTYLTLWMALALAASVEARVFEAGERLYINMEAADVKAAGGDLTFGWYSTYENFNRAYFYNSTDNAWSGLVKYYVGSVWYVEAPAGDWEYVILTRHSNGTDASFGSVITQTGNIPLFYYDGMTKRVREQNYIQNFYYDDGYSKNGAYWQIVAPTPSGDPASWGMAAENVELCTAAAGESYTLQARNFDYDNTYSHAWFAYSDGTWSRLQGDDWRNSEEDKIHTVTLGSAYSDTYYYLLCSRPSMCRLVRIRLNHDCSEGAPGACAITSFVAVASDANVTDKTSAIDGLVAFDDKKNAGDLMIWYPGIDTVIIKNEDTESPQTFKLEHFPASAITTYTLQAKFLNGTGCEKTCDVTVRPPTASVTTHTTTQTAGDMSLTRFTQEDVTLTPTNQTSTSYSWTNSDNDEKFTEADLIRNRTFTAPAEEKDITYVFLAANDPEAPEGNLIVNGDFEYDGGFTSSYDPWGVDQTDYYSSHPGASGGYALSRKTLDFSAVYQEVSAHHGSYFGLFDSKIYDGTPQYAWQITTALNPKLKVQAGVSYLFSFWVANINKYDEMNNGAVLQFQISYDGGTTWNDLGAPINLNDFKDNRWHGRSSIATPAVSSGNVALRVINLNTSTVNIGNDFALDDIRFEAVTTRSTSISAYELFPVRYLKCVISDATFTQQQPASCGAAQADVSYTVNYVHPRGDLYIYEGSELLAHIPHDKLNSATSHSGVIKNRDLDNADHTLTVYFDDTHVKTGAPTTYTYNAKAAPAASVKSTAWSTPACDETTCTLTAVVRYTNQNGTLTASVDGGTAVTQTYETENDAEKEATIIIPGVTADGRTGHKLTVTFSGSHGCQIADYGITEAAPYMPDVKSYTATVQPYGCGEGVDKYQVLVETAFANGQAHNLVIEDWKGNKQTLTTLATDTKAAHTFSYDWETPATHEYKVWFEGAESCKDNHKPAFTSPAKPVISVAAPSFTAMDCGKTTYTLSAAVTYTNQNGTLRAWVDGGTPLTFAYDANQADGKTVTVTIPGLTGDGASHKLNVEFDGSHGCSRTGADAIPFTAPLALTVSDVTLTPKQMKCGETEFKVTVTATLSANAAGRTLTVSGDNGTDDYVVSGTAFSQEYTVTRSSAAGKFRVFFNDAVNCDSQKTKDYTYTAPTAASMSVDAVTVPAPACDQTSFSLDITGSYDHLNGSKLLFVWDDETKKTQTVMPKTAGKINVTLTGLAYDGKNHTLTVRTDNTEYDCEHTQTDILAPSAPIIVSLTLTQPKQADCGADKYYIDFDIQTKGQKGGLVITDENATEVYNNPAPTATLHDRFQAPADLATHTYTFKYTGAGDCSATRTVKTLGSPTLTYTGYTNSDLDADTTYVTTLRFNYANQTGDLVIADENDTETGRISQPGQSFDLPRAKADGKTHTLYAYFADMPACKIPCVYESPAVPHLLIVPAAENADCDGTYEAVFKMAYENQKGNLVIDNGKETKTYPQGAQPFEWREKVTADGSGYTIQVWFDGGAKRVAQSSIPEPPVTGVINSVTTDTASVACNSTTYDLSVTLNVTNPTGDVILECGGRKITVPFAVAAGQAEKVTTISDLPIDAPATSLKAYFAARPDCDMTVVPLHNVKRSCIEVADTVCEGANYDKYGLNIPSVSMTDKKQYQVADTITALYVVPQPTLRINEAAGQRICSSETVYPIDYTATGESDTYSILFHNAQFADVVGAALGGGIQIDIPANVKPGRYTADITIGHHATDCGASGSFTFEVSAADMLYSKWNDVLLVPNRDSLFAAYQWYHNGLKMEGETQQRLYNPADRTGTFHCVVTMNDGTQFTTCDGAFGQVPLSRDQNKVTPTQVRRGMPVAVHRAATEEGQIGVYTVTGQSIASYTVSETDVTIEAPTQAGVYIVTLTDGGETWTQKIVVK